MVADVSGIVNALTTVPGQGIAQLGATLGQAQQERDKKIQQTFENNMTMQKAALEKAVADKQIGLYDLQIADKQSDFIGGYAQELLATKDPQKRAMMLQNGLDQAKKLGLTEAQQQEMVNASQDPYYAIGLSARTMAAKDFYASYLADKTGKDVTQSNKRMKELEAMGVPHWIAMGIGYGTYKTQTDPTTGDQLIVDLRRSGSPIPKSEQQTISDSGLTKEVERPYAPGVTPISRGNRVEMKLQDRVKAFSDGIGKSNIAEQQALINQAQAIIDEATAKGENIPGYHMGVGIPDWAAFTQRDKNFLELINKIKNITLKDRSGSAVTENELNRLEKEMSTGMVKTPEDLKNWLHGMQVVIDANKERLIGGVDPQVVQRYQQNGGFMLHKYENQGEPTQANPEQPPAKSKTPTAPKDMAEVRANAKKYGWSEEQVQQIKKRFDLKE